jgi:homopolymeric O-antigen transport system permease protein
MTNVHSSKAFLHRLDVLYVLVEKEMKAKYKVASLGYLWSVCQPLMSSIIFYYVFKIVIRINIENYPLFLVIGLFAWQWFAVAVNNALTSLIHNASVIKKINFPRELIPTSIVVVEMLHFIITAPILLGMMFFSDVKPHLNTLFLFPVVLIVQFSFTFAVCLLVSTVNLFFRDLERLVTIFMMLLFYLTPVVYAFDMVPVEFQYYVLLNPMASIVTSWRDILLHGNLQWSALGLAAMCSSVLVLVSYWVFVTLSPRFAELL